MNIVLNLFGPSAAGKSTTAARLQERIDDLHIVDFDVVKRREIPDYDWSKHSQLGRDLTLDELARTVSKNVPILLLMPLPKNEEGFNRTSTLATKHGYRLINIEITAPKEILIERYAHRMANIDPAKKGWKFKTLDEFKAKLDEPYYKPPGTITFDTSRNNPDEIVRAILHQVTDSSDNEP